MKTKKQNAIEEVSTNPFIAACVNFQQAKSDLSRYLGDPQTSPQTCDEVSKAVYTLANKAMHRAHSKKRALTTKSVKNGDRQYFRDIIVKSVANRKTFTTEDVIKGLKRQKMLPESKNLKTYITGTFVSNPKLFQRIRRGVYRIKTKSMPKVLPAPTTE